MSDQVADSIRNRVSRNYSRLLRGISTVSQKRVAELVGVSPTTMNDLINDGRLERAVAVFAAAGLKQVPVTDQTFDESYISALKTLAAIGLGSQQSQMHEVDE